VEKVKCKKCGNVAKTVLSSDAGPMSGESLVVFFKMMRHVKGTLDAIPDTNCAVCLGSSFEIVDE
jgi:hypothetical protein